MALQEVLGATIDRILERELRGLEPSAELSLIELLVQLVEDLGDQVGAFVTYFTETQGDLSQVGGGEKLLGLQAKLEVVG